jgi:CRISPR-associated endonuclease/helicase Cas3
MTKRRDERSKRQKIDEIFLALRDHHEGLTQSELAGMIDIGRWDINKYVKNGDLPGVYEENGRLYLDRLGDLVRMSFDRDEITMMHVAMRLLSRHTNAHNPHAASALRKLSDVIKRLDPDVSRSLQRTAGLADAPTFQRNDELINTLRVLTEARLRRRKVNVEYELDDGTLTKPYIFSPYFIEPYAPGLTTHVIGFREPPGEIRTFKVERLRNARIDLADFAMPDDFDPTALLNDAWGIWYTNESPVEVVLKFAPSVRRRVLETRWHRNQADPEVLEDGSVIWRCWLAEPREMLPWVRGWGADVEVLAPAALKAELHRSARALAKLYGVARVQLEDTQMVQLLQCWGKTGAGGTFHPAIFHMLDVAQVARVLLDDAAPIRWRRALARSLNADEAQLKDWLPYFVALHDIGKISIPFQAQNATQLERMKHEGFVFDGWLKDDFIRHEIISRVFLENVDLPEPMRYLAEAISGHHGSFVGREKTKEARNLLRKEHASWHELRQRGDALLRTALLVQMPAASSKPHNVSAAIMALTGFMILCDWIGSDARFFKPAYGETWDDYIAEAHHRAAQAAESAGLLTPVESDAPGNVEALFADLNNLRPLQLAVNRISDDLFRIPTLTLIEAPTGEGKTEAALALARRIARINGTDEMFYALPTMATSNQMFGRLQKHLHDRLKLGAQVKLAHGQAFLVEDDLRAEAALADLDPLSNGDSAQAVREVHETMAWFSGKKRALLAPFGVGTVDQIELAVLNVKHLALRMAGLLGKVVIVDEVHAYDTYMTTIVERLLRWLAQMGTSVILLSATLPLSRRERLLKAFGATTNLAAGQAEAYPSLLVANAQAIHHASPEVWQPNRVIALNELQFGDADAETKARWLLAQVADGGCACWMTNTVKRAQNIFAKLRELAPADVRLDLLHSQLPLEERQRRESDLSAIYGRTSDAQPRPPKGVVVGTQVLEQSLDLDFDVMASDLAPIDLLLQRAGRLHRHDRSRPDAHTCARLFLNFQTGSDGNLKLGSDRTIYAPFIMRRTHQTLEGRVDKLITLPADYRILIEAVYGGAPPIEGDVLYNDWLDLKSKEDKAKAEANERLIPFPNERDSFAETIAQRIALIESENRAGYLIAQTRLGEPSLNVIPLERTGDIVQLADETPSVNAEAPRATQLRLLRRHLRVSNPDAIAAIEFADSITPTRLFQQSVLLGDFCPLWLTQGMAQLQTAQGKTLSFKLDPDLGLVIGKVDMMAEDKKDGNTHDIDE